VKSSALLLITKCLR